MMALMVEATQRTTRNLDQYGFRPREMNNEAPETLTATVNAKLAAAGSPVDFAGIQQWVVEHAPNAEHHPAAAHLGILSAVGYHRDPAKITTASRISDTNHADLGLAADVLVTDDRNLRERLLATVHELQLPVRVVCSSEAVEVINALGAPGP